MLEKPLVYLSNSTKKLYELLQKNLFSTAGDPFKKKRVILPDSNNKTPFLLQALSDGTSNISLGVEWLSIGSGIQALFKEGTGKTLLFPSLDLLSLHIEGIVDSPGLAHSLAKEFLRYGKFGGDFIEKWGDHWQKKIWDEVISTWNYPYELLKTRLKKGRLDGEVHLLNFPFLPKLYHLFFEKVSQQIPVYYYQFSPCAEFWSDELSDYEKMKVVGDQKQLTLYFDSGNPLLAEWGKMGRENFRVFEEEDFIFEEHYVYPKQGQTISALQTNLLNNQKKEHEEKDPSLLLCPAPHRLREVEILFEKLVSCETLPSEIQVFAPDISLYAPFIEQVFGANESPFDFAIRDLSSEPFFQTFLDLLNLNDKRFKKEAVFCLLSSPFFSPLAKKEVEDFRFWIEHSGVKWGVDRTHRRQLLPDLIDDSDHGTWEEAFDELVHNLIYLPEESSDWDLPYLDFSESETLGKGIEIIRSLRKDLEFLSNAHLLASKWEEALQGLVEKYLHISEEGTSYLYEKLNSLKSLNDSYSFSSIKRYLMGLLTNLRGVKPSKQLEALTFRSLNVGTVRETEVIALMGMDEEAFPRFPVQSSLNLLGQKGDYCPSPPDEDRYILLEIISSAKEQLIVTYQNIGEEDGKEKLPSLLLQTLPFYSEQFPPFPFHHSYFKEERGSALHRHFDMAKHFYQEQKPRPFIPEFLTAAPFPQMNEEKAPPSLEELSSFAKHPLKHYCNHTLNLYLHYDDQTDEEFLLSPLQKYQLRGDIPKKTQKLEFCQSQRSRFDPLEAAPIQMDRSDAEGVKDGDADTGKNQVLSFLGYKEGLNKAAEKGHLPLGRFREIAYQKIAEECEMLTASEQTEGHAFNCTAKLSDLIKVYPHYLVLCAENNLPLIAAKTKVSLSLTVDPKEALKAYHEYFHLAQQTPSPLHPLLADALLRKDESALQKQIKTAINDQYLSLIFSSPKEYDPHVIFHTWAPVLRKVFRPLMEMIS